MKNPFIKSVVYAGLILAAIFIMIDLINYTFDLITMGMMIGFLSLLVSLAIYFLIYIRAGRKFRDSHLEGKMNYGKAFLFCVSITLVYALTMLIYNTLFNYLFDPERLLNDTTKVAQMIQDNEYIPEEDKEKTINEMMASVSNVKSIIKNFAGNLVMGLIIGSISALFIRKKQKIEDVVY